MQLGRCEEKSLRVVEVIRGFGLGGTEQALLNRLASAPRDVSTRVIVLGALDPHRHQQLRDVAPLDHLPKGTSRKELLLHIARGGPDVVLLHNPRTVVDMATTLRAAKVPFVVVAHAPVLSDSRALNLALRLPMSMRNPLANGHIAVSEAVARGPWCTGSQRIQVVPLGSEVVGLGDNASQLWPEQSRVRILVLGRLVNSKQVVQLVKSAISMAHSLLDHGAHIAVVGGGPRAQAIQRLVDSSGSRGIVSMHPPVSNPASILQAADWLLIGARLEGGPLTAFEAAILGTGIAATPVGVLPTLLADYPGGIMARGSTRRDLSSLLGRVLIAGATSQEDRAAWASVGKCWRTSHLADAFYRAVSEIVECET